MQATPDGSAAENRVRRGAEAARAFAVRAAQTLADDKCTEVAVLDLRGRSPVTDYFVIASGVSERQMRSAALHVAEAGEGMGFPPFRSNKDESGQTWYILDFVDVVVHVFDPPTRAYYDLEMLWGDADRVTWAAEPRPAPRGAAATPPSPAPTPGEPA